MRLFCLGVWFALSCGLAAAQSSPLQMSVLPNARSGQVDTEITFFATVVNSSETEANSCRHTGFDTPDGLPDGVGGTLEVFALDADRNIEGAANSFFTVPPGGSRDLLVSFNIDAPMQDALSLNMRCQFERNEFRFAPNYPGVNDFGLTVTADAGPDIVMIGDTLSNDGVMRVSQTPRVGLVVVSAINIGADTSDLVVTPSYLGFTSLNNLRTEICETNASGACVSTRGDAVSIANWASGEVKTFAAFFVQSPALGLPFFPDILRAQVQVAAAPQVPSGLSTPQSGGQPGLARTSTAVSAEVEGSLDGDPPFWGVYQCSLQEQLPLGSVANQSGGELFFGLFEEAAAPGGYLRASDTQGGGGWIPVAVPEIDRAIHEVAQQVVVTLLGMGEGRLQVTDRDVAGSAILRPYLSVVISTSAAPGLENSFEFDTRIRCVPSPSSDPATEPTGEEALDSIEGSYRSEDVNEDAPRTVEEILIEASEIERRRKISLSQPAARLLAGNRDDHPDFGRTSIDPISAFHGFFELLSLGGSADDEFNSHKGYYSAHRTRSTDGNADCGVLVRPDTDADESMQDRDAEIRLMRRSESVDELNEGECIL